jgi:polyphosphate kinase 2 (PPK2 family)
VAEQETIELSQVDELQERLALIEKERDSLQAMVEKDEPLHPYQVELLKLQRHIEVERIPMIVLFEGRDASGKGGTIRRVMRYMNDKRVRAVALGKPTEEQTTQWYFQRYVTQFPAGGEMILFDRSWYNRALVEPCRQGDASGAIRSSDG